MEKTAAPRSRGDLCRLLLKGLFLYALFPLLLLWLLSGPLGKAVRASAPAAWLILGAALAAVCLNWFVYIRLRRRRPSLLVLSWGAFCLLLLVVFLHEALRGFYEQTYVLGLIGGCLALAFLFLLSYWLAARRSRAAHVFAVGLWIVIGIIAFFIAYQVIRDIESRRVTLDTWLNILILLALIPAASARRILAARRRKAFLRRASALAEGTIVQLVGETSLDRDEDLVTDYHARVEYEVGGVRYETRAEIRKLTMRYYGKQAFVGRAIPVHYDPASPADAWVARIDRRFLKEQDDEEDR